MKPMALFLAGILVAACGADVDPSDEQGTFDVPRETEQAPLPGGGHPPDGLSCRATCTGGDEDCHAGTVWVEGTTKDGMCCSATRCASCNAPEYYSCTSTLTKNPPLPPPPPSNTRG